MPELSEENFIIILVLGTLFLLSLIVLISLYLVRLLKATNKKQKKETPIESIVVKEGADYKVTKSDQSSERYEIYDYKLKPTFNESKNDDGRDQIISEHEVDNQRF